MWGSFRCIFYFIHMPKKNKIPCLPSKRGNKLPNTKLISDKCDTLDTMNSHPDWNKNRPGLRLLLEMYCSAGIKSPQSPRAKWNLPEVSEKLVITVRTGWVVPWYKHHLSGYLDSSCLTHAFSSAGGSAHSNLVRTQADGGFNSASEHCSRFLIPSIVGYSQSLEAYFYILYPPS